MSAVDWEHVGLGLVEKDVRPVAVVDRSGRVLKANAAFRSLTGDRPSRSAEWVSESSLPAFLERLRSAGARPRRMHVTLGGPSRFEALVELVGCGPGAVLATILDVWTSSPLPLQPVGGLHYEVALRDGQPVRLVRKMPGDGSDGEEPCWKQVFGATTPCDDCPLRRLGDAGRASGVVSDGRGGFHVLRAERRSEGLAAVTAWHLEAELLPKLHEAQANRLARRAQLSNREKDVLFALLRGASHEEAAAALGLTPRTVKYHQQNLYRKLRVRSRNELQALLR